MRPIPQRYPTQNNRFLKNYTSNRRKKKNLERFKNRAFNEVRENELASLQDQSYSFDEMNTDNEEYHDADADFDPDNSDDFVRF
jgi:hypothetical protein